MKRLLVLFFVFSITVTLHAQVKRTLKVGKLIADVFDHSCQSEDVQAYGHCIYYRGSYVDSSDYKFMWPGGFLKDAGMFFGSRNWTDTTGYTWDALITGHCVRKRTSDIYQFAVPDENDGYTIHRYFRYPPPMISVNGTRVEDPFPLTGDEIAPEKIWGTADVMVESNVRLSMGLDVKQRVLAWSQPGHDDYVIWDWTFVNTGNVDQDSIIELPGQTLEDVYITRVTEAMINGTGANKVMPTWAGTTEDEDTRLSYPQDDDSLRIDYVTPLRAHGLTYDSYGKKPNTSPSLLDGARFAGTAVLFAPKSTDVPQSYPIANIATSNDPAQPSMHSSLLTEATWIIWAFPYADTSDYIDAYEIMVMGGFGIDSTDHFFQDVYHMDSVYNVYDTTASGGKTHYEQPLDRWGELDPSRGYVYAGDIMYLRFDQQCHFSIGPYQMEFGDTLRYVYAYVGGAVSRKSSYLAGEAWNSGEAAAYSWLAGLDSATMVEELRRRDPIFNIYHDESPGINPTPSLNDIAKDLLVATGRDSLFNNGMNAQRNFNMNYNIPTSPAPPTAFFVDSGANSIHLSWYYEPGFEPVELAGFKIYRAIGSTEYRLIDGDSAVGEWVLLDSLSPLNSSYVDSFVPGGVDFYYAITAVGNNGIESGIYLTMMPEGSPVWAGVDDKEYSFRGIEISPSVFSKFLVVKYTLSERLPVTLSMFDITGRCVQTFLSGESQSVGEYTMELKPSLPSGIYFLNIKVGEDTDCKKCVLLE